MLRIQHLAQQRRLQIKQARDFVPVFRGAAKMLQETQHFETIIAGPAETGKTFAALWRVDNFLREYPGAQGLITRQTQKSIYLTALRTYDRLIAARGNDVKPYGGQKPEWYDYQNGSRLTIAGLDNIDKILSGEYDIILIVQCEGITLDDWEKLITRATGRSAQAPYTLVLGDANPAPSNHWILKRKTLQLLKSEHRDNPTLYDDNGVLTPRGERSMQILSSLTGVRKLRLYQGLWANAEGAIYGDYFNRAVHVIRPFQIPQHWPRIRVIDFGYRNPFVCHWYALDPDTTAVYLYREIYKTETLVEDHAKHIAAIEGWEWDLVRQQAIWTVPIAQREYISMTIADHDAEDRATLAKYGIDTRAAIKHVKLGIEAVQIRLRDNKLFFFEDALVETDPLLEAAHKPTCTLDEIEAYVWAETKNERAVKEEPVKKDDHGCDALRYLVAAIDSVGEELEEMQEFVVMEQPQLISVY